MLDDTDAFIDDDSASEALPSVATTTTTTTTHLSVQEKKKATLERVNGAGEGLPLAPGDTDVVAQKKESVVEKKKSGVSSRTCFTATVTKN